VLSTQSVIWSLSYDENTENIVLIVNSSLKEWDLCLMQIVKDKKWQHVCKYDNETWFVTESVYNIKARMLWSSQIFRKSLSIFIWDFLYYQAQHSDSSHTTELQCCRCTQCFY